MHISLQDISRAREAQDPALAQLCISLAHSDETGLEDDKHSDKALETYFETIDSKEFTTLPDIEQARFRVQQFKLIESQDSQNTPQRYHLYTILLELWETNGLYERRILKELIADAPLVHGVWKALKTVYKEAQEKDDTDMFGAVAARLDAALADKDFNREISRGTLTYLVRRAWRHLRNLGLNFPSTYCQAAVDILKSYPDSTYWPHTWIANHIFHHDSGKYGGKNFKASLKINDRLRHRAFAELWQRQPQPLIRLLEEANSKVVLNFAISSLKKEHAIALRDISETAMLRLLKQQHGEVDEFCVWVFDSVPKFEHARLRELGLHEAAINLLKSSNRKALHFAATYVRSHAKDLALKKVLELVNHSHKEVRELAVSFINERDPRKEIGLDAWAELLGTQYGGGLAEKAIIKHFSGKELTKGWFKAALLKQNSHAFAEKHLFKVHKIKDLGTQFFIDIFNSKDFGLFCSSFVMSSLRKFAIEELDSEFLRQALFNDLTRVFAVEWVDTGFCDSKLFGVDFLMSLAYQPEWQSNEWIQNLIEADKENENDKYPEEFDEELSEGIFGWLSDVRKFQPNEIGDQRLMQLVERKEAAYHDFASKYMVKAFVPADFAPSEGGGESAEASPDDEINIDLEGQTFVFTGKLKTMTRSVAQGKVKEANGKKGSGVTGNLDYLVIGDEGSPFYGAGKKGSKQLKGESLIEGGAKLKIISETAFLQMLAGRRNDADEDTVTAGCEKLWEFATQKGGERHPIRLFALSYIRNHHQDISPLLTERPVDPGAEIPHDFLTFERLLPLFNDKRQSLVEFALELARWEASKWDPQFKQIFELCENGPIKVREFFAKALTAGVEKVHERYRLPASLVNADNVYRLCESPDDFARNLGMQLLDLHPHLADATSLFRLTESADRRMRYFAVEAIWRSFRDRGVSDNWTPPIIVEEVKASKGQKKVKVEIKAETKVEKVASEKPSPWLSEQQVMQDFLRRMLYELPPGRSKGKRRKVKTLSSAKAKVALVETYRNMALSDKKFAAMAVPVLSEFMASKGQLEERACLVALARISKEHPELNTWKEAVAP